MMIEYNVRFAVDFSIKIELRSIKMHVKLAIRKELSSTR